MRLTSPVEFKTPQADGYTYARAASSRRIYLKGSRHRLGLRAIGVEEAGLDLEGAGLGAAQVHGELQLPAHRLDDAGGGNLIAGRIGDDHLHVRALLERGHLDVDPDALSIGVGLGAERGDMGLLRAEALQVVFREEEIHASIITTGESRRIPRNRAVGLQFCEDSPPVLPSVGGLGARET